MDANWFPAFYCYIGIDYSGAKTPTSSLKGLRIYMADRASEPVEVQPPFSPRKYWTRRSIAEWLSETLSGGKPALVGIDHGFSFPLAYFERHNLARNWDMFLDDFCSHWPTDQDDVYVDFVRSGVCGNGTARLGNSQWRRVSEVRAGAARSVFHFDVQGSVAKSTHAGVPWLRHLRRTFGPAVHFWPFDGWMPPPDKHVIAEVYPSLWRHLYRSDQRSPDQHDGYSISRWLQETDLAEKLPQFFQPQLAATDRAIAEVEGWILGVA